MEWKSRFPYTSVRRTKICYIEQSHGYEVLAKMTKLENLVSNGTKSGKMMSNIQNRSE